MKSLHRLYFSSLATGFIMWAMTANATIPKTVNKPDMPGKRFGRLLVLEFSHVEKGLAHWKCQCDCGKEKIANGATLRNGGTSSCGCYQIEVRRLARQKQMQSVKSEVGNRYGRLTVVSRDKIQPRSAFWNCICECGNVRSVRGGHLRSGEVVSCGVYSCLPKFQKILASVDVLDATYLAGHFDGEGCILFQKQKKAPYVVAKVCICYRPTVERYKALFGGSVYSKKRSNRERTTWEWSLGGAPRVLHFINTILPYSTEKKPQLELAKAYLDERLKASASRLTPELHAKLIEWIPKMSALKKFHYA